MDTPPKNFAVKSESSISPLSGLAAGPNASILRRKALPWLLILREHLGRVIPSSSIQ